MQLSIVMMVKNESKYLERCLRSLQPILKVLDSELIIVDTGSEDDTVEIAKQYTDKVYFHKWNKNFAHMRNRTISYAKGDWIFVVDGDEILETPQEIIDFFNTNKNEKYNTGIIRIKNYTKEEKKYSLLSIARLFKRHKNFKYEGAIHEQPMFSYPVYYLNSTLVHYGYLKTDKELVEKKFLRNTEILRDELKKDPENIYYWFQLSQSYACHQDFEDALEANLKAYNIAKRKKLDLSKRMHVYTHLAQLYYWLQNYNELEKISEESINVKDGYIDIYYYLGKARQKLLKCDKAIEAYKKYLDMVFQYENFNGYNDITITTNTLDIYEYVYGDLSILYTQKGDYETALSYISKIKSLDIIKEILETVITAYLNLNRLKELKVYYEERIVKNGEKLVIEFISHLEKLVDSYAKRDRQEIISLFSKGNCIFSLLNKIRLAKNQNKQELCFKYLKKIEKLDFNNLPECYGEIILTLMKYNDNLVLKMLKNVREIKIQSYFYYLAKFHKNEFINIADEYLSRHYLDLHLAGLKINKALTKVILLTDTICDSSFEFYFHQFVEQGIQYIRQVYRKNIIEKQRLYDVKNDEDAFLLCMYHAKKLINQDTVKYINELKKALKIYPNMKKGIQILLNEIQQKTKNLELEKEKQKIRQQIKNFINNGQLDKANILIKEYEDIIDNDFEVNSYKGILYMIQGDIDKAEEIFKRGLKYKFSDDLLYNLAYIYEIKNDILKAKEFYDKTLRVTTNEEMIKELKIKIADFNEEAKMLKT